MQTKITLTSTQFDLIEQIHQYYERDKKSCLLFLPMGGGKTIIALQMMVDAVGQGKRVLFCCHRTKLVIQTQEKLKLFFGIEAGIIWANEVVDYTKPIQIAMFQTLQNRELPPDIDFCVFDEAHTTSYWQVTRMLMNHYSGGILALSKCLFLGLTASPWRAKRTKEGYCQFFDCLVRGPYFGEMVNLQEVTPPRYFGWNGLIDFSQLEVSSEGDYTQASLEKVCDENLSIRIVQEYQQRFSHLKPIVFCASVHQASDLADKFNDAGISCGLIVGETLESDREIIYSDYAKGDKQVLSGVSVFCEGFDEPSCDAVILARPTTSLSLLFQICGRSTRLYPGKLYAYLLDFCENFQRLGYITENHRITLCPLSSQVKFIRSKLKSCPECNTITSSFAKICTNCGYIYSDTLKTRYTYKNSSYKAEEVIKYGELLSLQQRRMLKFIRRKMAIALEAGTDPSIVQQLFFEKFRMLPPRDWLSGAVFGGESFVGNMHVYWQFLRRVRPNAPSWWYSHWMRMEFGDIENFSELEEYKNRNNNQQINQQINQDIPLVSQDLDWSSYLGVSDSSSWEEILSQYRYLIKNANDSEVLIANVALENAAIAKNQWNFVSSVNVNRATVNEHSYRALQLANNVIQASVAEDILKLRSYINQDLTLWQRYAIRLLTNQEFFAITKQLQSTNFTTQSQIIEISSPQWVESLLGKWIMVKNDSMFLVKDINFEEQYLTAYSPSEKYSITLSIKTIKSVFDVQPYTGLVKNDIGITEKQWLLFINSLTKRQQLLYNHLVFPRQTGYHLFLYARKVIFAKVKEDFLENKLLSVLIDKYNLPFLQVTIVPIEI